MKVDYEHYWEESMKVARAQGIVSAFRILSDIDKRFGKDTSDMDRLLDLLESELGDE